MESSIIGTVVSLVWTPIVRQVELLFKAGANVNNLNRAAERLKVREGEVKEKIEAATSSEVVPTERVLKWQKDAKDTGRAAVNIQEEYNQRRTCLGGCPLNCWSAYKISKRAASVTVELNALTSEEEKLTEFTRRMVPTVKRFPTMPHPQLSAELNLKAACDYLQDDRVGMVGIWGMGGVGKTSLLKRINDHPYVKAAGFDYVIFVVASQDLHLGRLQKDIAKRIGLYLEANATVQEQGESLYHFLKLKKFMLLLDDIWEAVDLARLGVPCPTSSTDNVPTRKVVFTTRSEKVCDQMMACQEFQSRGEKIKVKCMEDKEAWQLFLDNVGETARMIINSDERVHSCAGRVAKKCGGLPLALIVIAHAMSSNKIWQEWEDAVDSLDTIEMQEMWSKGTDPFPLLKVSYDRLPDDTVRKCFLYCASWPEDYRINEDDLIMRWLGLSLINNFNDIRAAHNKGVTIIQRLKQACMLEADESFRRNKYKMHDIIRGMALWIASDCRANKNRWVVSSGSRLNGAIEDLETWREAEVISLYDSNVALPQHPDCPRLLTLFLHQMRVPPGFFQNMSALKCLELNVMEVPASIGYLVGLRYLTLTVMMRTSLPMELSRLTELKCLIIWGVPRIPYGLISKLEKLEICEIELYGGQWGKEGEVSLEEFKCLRSSLKALSINVHKFSELKQISREPKVSLWKLKVNALEEDTLPLSETILQNDNNWRSLQNLTIVLCPNLEKIVLKGMRNDEFVNLQILKLYDLPKLHKITFEGIMPGGLFCNVTFLEISCCHVLKNITWIQQLQYLETFALSKCFEIEQVICDDDNVAEQKKRSIFSHLKYLDLCDLPSLRSFVNHEIDLCSLRNLFISLCPMLDETPFSNHKIKR